MIIGSVNANREATVRLLVHGAQGQALEIEAILDTGFTGFLTLPLPFIASLGLAWRGRAQAVLADGSLHPFDVYAGTVTWDSQFRTMEIDAADSEPLVGMSLIYGYDLRIQAVDGGTVTLEVLP